MSNPAVYYRSYGRAVLKARNNGFWARVLDPQDFALLERVRRTGRLRCGSLADPIATDCTYSDNVINRRVALLEEMDFWQSPTGSFHAPRHGPVDRPPKQPPEPTPHALEIKRRRALKEAELAAEVARVEAKQRELLRRDLEWEMAAPKRMPFGKTAGRGGRHYIPQWKLDQWREAERLAAQARAEAQAEAWHVEEQIAEYEQRRAKAEAERWIAYVRSQNIKEIKESILPIIKAAFPNGRWPQFGPVAITTLMQQTGVTDVDLMKQCVDELAAQQAEAEAQRLEQQTKAIDVDRPNEELDDNYKHNIKQSIHAILKRAFPYGITLEELMRKTGVTDVDLMKTCLDEMSAEVGSEIFPHRGGTAARIPPHET